MKKKSFIAIALLLVVGILAGCTAGSTASPMPTDTLSSVAPSAAQATVAPLAIPEQSEQIALAQTFVQLLIDGKYDEAMAEEMPLHQEFRASIEQLGGAEAFINEVVKQTGKWLSVGEFSFMVEQNGNNIFQSELTAENDVFKILVVYSPEFGIGGLQLLPLAENAIVMPKDFSETAITVDAGEGFPLEGRLVKPIDATTKVPVVLLIQGSGASDYDEVVGANREFGKIAFGLASRGIATLRYAKRNYAYPAIMKEKDYTVKDEYVSDVLAAVKLLQLQEGIGPIYLLGHSQGGMLAPMFVKAGADVQGMILFAGSPRHLIEILQDQQVDIIRTYEAMNMQSAIDEYNKMQISWKADWEKLKAATAEEAKDMDLVYGMGAYYLHDLLSYDAITTIKSLQKPTLILQGSMDKQVYAEVDYAMYEREVGAEPYVEMHLYQGLSHLFTPSKAQNVVESVSEYNTVMQIPDQVYDDIADWITSQSK